MKKILAMVLAVVSTVSLAACGGSPEESTAPSGAGTVPSPTTQTEQTEVPVFQETVIVDDESCTFRIVSVDDDSPLGYTMNAYLENKTDKELMFSLGNVSVNGFMCDPFWASTVTAGMKSNEEISFSSSDFKANGITEVTDITFTLKVYDNADWTAEYLVEDVFTIYPLGEDAVQVYQRTPVEGEIVLLDDENCTMIVTGYDPDNIWGYTVNVYLENKTNAPVMFSVDNVSVNGFMCDPFWAESVAPGKRSNSAISWMESTFEDNGITEVESISLPVRVYDETNWNDYVNETFTLEP